MKIVLSKCYGGFSLSPMALDILGIEYEEDIERTDPRLVEVVEADAKAASGLFAELTVVEIPDEATDYSVDEYDGFESVVYVVDGKLHWA